MVYLAFRYLFRRGRVSLLAAEIDANLSTTFGVSLCNQSFLAIAAAVGLDWTNDPFDRMIVAHALCDPRSRLATANETIQVYFERAVW